MLNNQKPIPVLLQDLGMLYPTETSKQKYRYGIFMCQCGKEFKTQVSTVKSGVTSSCGCYHKQRVTTHGLRNHPLYKVWSSIIDRTTNQKQKHFKDYGGRGITICDEWRNNFKVFYDWAMTNNYTKGLQIDRSDNNGNYNQDNCRFVTSIVNTRNTRIIQTNNVSGYRGVYFRKSRSKWVSQISINWKQKHLGYFTTALEAAVAYDKYVIENNLEHTINGVIK